MAVSPVGVRWWHFTLVLALLVLVAGSWYAVTHAKTIFGGTRVDTTPAGASAIAVEVVTPQAGGIDRICTQPGTVEPFEAADLYAKVSGFLAEQSVDIGSVVKEKQVLARIAAPEHEKQLQKDAAEVRRAEAKRDLALSAVATAEADLGAAQAGIAFARAEKKSKTSYRAYREKQRDRIQELVLKNAVDPKLGEEQEDHYQAATSAELASEEAVNTAIKKEAAAKARVEHAKADVKLADADVAVAKTQHDRSQVLLDYAIIRAPFPGVVTRRHFHPGDFIRSAESGGDRMPLLSVERTEKMRLVVQVPDRDVALVNPGDPAVVEIDALPGVVFKTAGENKVVISRSAESQDPHSHLMRTEIDLRNPDGKLRRGMYGRVMLSLRVGAADAVRVPSSAIFGKADGGKGSVRVVRGTTAHVVAVRYGTDTGSEVEILSGLTVEDRVIVRAAGPVEEGTPVTATAAAPGKSGH